MAVPYIPTNTGQSRMDLLLSPRTPPDTTVWLWKHFSTTGRRANQWEAYVPFAAGRYAVYAFGDTLGNGVLNWMATREGVPALWVDSDTATKSGTWNASTNAETYSGTYRYSETATNTISASVTGHTLFVRGPLASNGGYALVSIDGDATLANRLPVVTQALVDAGGFASGDLGKRYIETYSQNSLMDEHTCIAEGLSDAAHTVLITVKGTKRTAAAGNRVYVSAIGGATAGQALTATGAGMGYVRNYVQGVSTNDVSASGMVFRFTPTGYSNPRFMGNIHAVGGAESTETQSSAVWKDADNATITLANGAYTSSSKVTLTRVTAIKHPDTSGTTAFDKTCSYVFSGSLGEAQLAFSWGLTCQQAGTLDSFYGAMMPFAKRDYASTNFVTEFDRANVGGDYVLTRTDAKSGNNLGTLATPFTAAYSTDFDTVMVCHVPDPAATLGNYAHASTGYTYIWDRTDGNIKAYATRISDTDDQAVAVSDTFSGAANYRLLHLDHADAAIDIARDVAGEIAVRSPLRLGDQSAFGSPLYGASLIYHLGDDGPSVFVETQDAAGAALDLSVIYSTVSAVYRRDGESDVTSAASFTTAVPPGGSVAVPGLLVPAPPTDIGAAAGTRVRVLLRFETPGGLTETAPDELEWSVKP